MCKSKAKIVLLLAVAVSVTLLVSVSNAGVANSKHNLSSGSAATVRTTNGTDRICVFCHTPHFASADAEPLWNRDLTTSSYTLYTSSTLDATMNDPRGVSAACLSCHDGTVALDSLVNKPGSGKGTAGSAGWTFAGLPTGVNKLNATDNPAAFIDVDLTDDHPISFDWPTTDSGLVALATVQASTNVRLYGTDNNSVECGSCHDPHDTTYSPFLRSTNAASALCLTCHDK